MAQVTSQTEGDCPFCRIPTGGALLSNEAALAIPDAFPVCGGHTLVVPRAHVASVFDLPPAVQAQLWRLVADVRALLIEQFNARAFNVGVNDGLAAGQTVPHAHIHVIPRFAGDVADPRGGIRWVLPERAAYWAGSR